MSTTASSHAPPSRGQKDEEDGGAGGTRFRTVSLLRADGESPAAWESDGEASIPLAISSEAPVIRRDWETGGFYFEVLDHSPTSIDMSYATDGLPLLVEHWRGDQIGIVEGFRVDGDRRTRGEARTSASTRGVEIRSDLARKIRNKVSFGYDVDETQYVVSKADGDAWPTRRYLRWTPLEVSIVAIPADYTVGVGRGRESAPTTNQPAPAAEENTVSVPATAPAPGANAGVDPNAERTAGLVRLARDHKIDMGQLDKWLTGGTTVDAAKDELLARARGANPPIDASGQALPVAPASVRLTDREEREYSIVRGMQRLLNKKPEGFEFEVSETIAKQLGRSTDGFFVPTTLRAANPAALPDTVESRRAFGMFASPRERTMTVGGAGTGAEAKFTEFGGLIDALRARSAVLGLGAQMLPGLQGDVGFVALGAGTVGWTAEATNISAADVATALRTMGPKSLQGARAYTRQLLLQSAFSIENMMRTDLTLGHALEIDRAAIAGSGSSNQPRGILNTVGIGNVAIGAAGGAPTYEHLVDLEAEITTDNADLGDMGILTSARGRAKLRKTQEFSGTNGKAVWTGGIEGECAGYRARASNQVPGNLVKGASTDCFAILQAVWSELFIGEWGAMEIQLDPYGLAPAAVKITSIQFVDVFLRQIQAFAAIQDARNV
jgi:HK97 family phage major capsid protein